MEGLVLEKDTLTAPQFSGRPDLLIIAGEHSGDQHAARMLAQLKKRHPKLSVCAVGGIELQEAGAQLLYDLTKSSVVGLVEVLKHYDFFKNLFSLVIAWVREYKPRAICFVDYPGFNLRLAEVLHQEGLSRKGGGDIALYYYIGPQIWAWKAHRRFKMARFLDALGVIFPFEVECYKDTALPVSFVGHPFIDEQCEQQLCYDEKGPILLLPGSRVAAVKRIFPIMLATFERYLKKHPTENAVVPYPNEEIREVLTEIIDKKRKVLRGHVYFVKNNQLLRGKVVLTSSGTMSLLCALAGIPGAIVYRTHPLTYLLGRLMVRVNYLGIANLLLNRPVYPEYIQGNAKPRRLVKVLTACIEDKSLQEAALQSAAQIRKVLSQEGDKTAGSWLAELLEEDVM